MNLFALQNTSAISVFQELSIRYLRSVKGWSWRYKLAQMFIIEMWMVSEHRECKGDVFILCIVQKRWF